jgi:hypothetical protein
VLPSESMLASFDEVRAMIWLVWFATLKGGCEAVFLMSSHAHDAQEVPIVGFERRSAIPKTCSPCFVHDCLTNCIFHLSFSDIRSTTGAGPSRYSSDSAPLNIRAQRQSHNQSHRRYLPTRCRIFKPFPEA